MNVYLAVSAFDVAVKASTATNSGDAQIAGQAAVGTIFTDAAILAAIEAAALYKGLLKAQGSKSTTEAQSASTTALTTCSD
jgi:hypothetical protein